MRPRAVAVFLAMLMVWMGFTAQIQAASRSSEGLTESVQIFANPVQSPYGGTLDAHHLDELPLQLLADLVGLWPPLGDAGVVGLAVRPDGPLARAGASPDPAQRRRPPIARG